MLIREEIEAREQNDLAPWAMHAVDSKGRLRKEPQDDLRPVFQRDRDRVVHCKSFRRLKDKTQVFITPDGDHYRTRMTHTLEVSQNARTIAKALRLNESLTEAIALGHDLGHTPFGHCGEGVLNQLCEGGFVHSEQSVRIVELLEKDGAGLNLTWEVRDGIRNHRTSGHPATPEGQAVRICDKIAYVGADIDDAIRAHLLTEDDIPLAIKDELGFSVKKRLNTLIHDVISTSYDSPEIRLSKEKEQALYELRQFLFEKVYKNPEAKSEEVKARRMIHELFVYYTDHFDAIPEKYRELAAKRGDAQDRVICDYIAGMTDDFATAKFSEYFVPRAWGVELD